MTVSDGWIGRWSPGIGDPTIIGWVTVGLYALGAWQSYRLVKRHSHLMEPREATLWRILALGLLALGINKQLDLQSALTEIGRMIAVQQGWYVRRHEVQKEFIYTIAVCAGLAVAGAAIYARKVHAATVLALVGSVCLLAFVVLRAASFHHVDALINSEYIGIKMNWLFEIGGICIILAAGRWRLRAALAQTNVHSSVAGQATA